MEREDSFEAIVAKAVNEVHRNRLLRRSSVRSLLFLVTFIAASERCATQITASQPHGRGQLFLWRVVAMEGCWLRGELSCPRGTDASSRGKPPPKQSLDGASRE